MKKAKKVKSVKKAVKKIEVKPVESDFNLWHVSCQIEEQAMKILQSKDFLSIIAAHDSGPESNALWMLFDVLEDIEVELTRVAESVMEEHRRTSKTVYAF